MLKQANNSNMEMDLISSLEKYKKQFCVREVGNGIYMVPQYSAIKRNKKPGLPWNTHVFSANALFSLRK